MGMFSPAVKHESKLRLAITGPSGSGKTYTALSVAKHLTSGEKIALVDTEHGSAAKYADIFQFDVLELRPPYHPDRFGEAIAEAAKAGYTVIILDSLTHAWSGSGGMLDIVDEIAKRNSRGGAPNTFGAWKDGTPIQQRLIESIVGAPIHVIATLRSKQDYAQEKDDRGKTVVRKVGMAAQQREGFEYEFDVVIDMDIDHNGVVTKSRAVALADRVFSKPGADVARLLADWLKGAPAPERKPEPTMTGNQAGNGQSASVVWQTWGRAADAYAWAVEQGACGNEFEAKNSLTKIVNGQFGGRLTSGNMAQVFEAFHAHQIDKIAQRNEANGEPPATPGLEDDVPFGMGDNAPAPTIHGAE